MAKVVYTVVFHVSRDGIKARVPALPGYYFTSETAASGLAEYSGYLRAFLRLLRKGPKPVGADPKKAFVVQNVFVQVEPPGAGSDSAAPAGAD